ncbi:hypothetical protein OC844_006537 [Tilletia horrida]|nr:hypothetical protein OC844_006537 [Tilletia horrida]
MDQLVIVIFAKRANAEEWAGQACVLHADGSHIVGIFENCLCASGRSAPAPAALRLSAPIAANAKTHTPVPASARFSKTTFAFKASPASSATAHSDASSTALSSGTTAPSSVGEYSEDEYEEVEVEKEVVEKKASSTGGGVDAFLELVVDTIAEETGTAPADIRSSAFADIGIDSLMSLALLDRLRDAAAMEIPGSLFIDCATMQDLVEFAKEHLPEAAPAAAPGKSTADVEAKAAAHPLAIPGADTSAGTSFDSLLGELDRPMKPDFPKITQPTASAVLLGGRKTNDGDSPRPLFLIQVGSGSAAVFQNLPAIGRVAYGLNSSPRGYPSAAVFQNLPAIGRVAYGLNSSPRGYPAAPSAAALVGLPRLRG